MLPQIQVMPLNSLRISLAGLSGNDSNLLYSVLLF
ncbi:Transposase [Shigella dysenteriae 1617]|uniref:Transposase n=1 Tax=Shigella dysenteriae 1617 TaxID=754093 RepID=A0A0A7A2G9_SHIDY|nr:Transposase [Shigella dysenteriae 1617]